jgi:hypothetical protein
VRHVSRVFYSGSYLGTKSILSFGASFEAQGSYDHWSLDGLLDLPLGPGVLTAQVNAVYLNGRHSVPLPAQTAVMAEAGYLFDALRLSPMVRYEERWVENQTAGAPDETRWGGGLAFWPYGHNVNLKTFYTRVEPEPAAHAFDQLNLQAQLFVYQNAGYPPGLGSPPAPAWLPMPATPLRPLVADAPPPPGPPAVPAAEGEPPAPAIRGVPADPAAPPIVDVPAAAEAPPTPPARPPVEVPPVVVQPPEALPPETMPPLPPIAANPPAAALPPAALPPAKAPVPPAAEVPPVPGAAQSLGQSTGFSSPGAQ